jgi:hypothetical protein
MGSFAHYALDRLSHRTANLLRLQVTWLDTGQPALWVETGGAKNRHRNQRPTGWRATCSGGRRGFFRQG